MLIILIALMGLRVTTRNLTLGAKEMGPQSCDNERAQYQDRPQEDQLITTSTHTQTNNNMHIHIDKFTMRHTCNQ